MNLHRWALRGCQIRVESTGQHVATYQICRDDGLLLAASPELLRMLWLACDTLDACERHAESHGTADEIRRALTEAGLPAERCCAEYETGSDVHGEECRFGS